ncbi:MAG: succinate dehydrogenase [Candidatus Eisenbacteria bacterium]
MRVSARAYATLKRLQIWTGVVPVGLFLLSHLATNARAIAGAAVFDRTAEAIGRIPGLTAIEVVAIALPMLLHVALGVALATTGQAAGDERGYPRPWMLLAQRATGFYLVIYVVFHVWGTRLSPDRLAGGADLFALMARRLGHPGVLAFHMAGVLAAAYHLGNGLVALAGPWGLDAGLRGRALAARIGLAAFIVLSLVGMLALLAFVSPSFRWLEPPRTLAP